MLYYLTTIAVGSNKFHPRLATLIIAANLPLHCRVREPSLLLLSAGALLVTATCRLVAVKEVAPPYTHYQWEPQLDH